MPLYPHYQPHFSEEEISLAQQMLRKQKAGQTSVKRARLVLRFTEAPNIPSPEGARQIGWHEQTVRKWRI